MSMVIRLEKVTQRTAIGHGSATVKSKRTHLAPAAIVDLGLRYQAFLGAAAGYSFGCGKEGRRDGFGMFVLPTSVCVLVCVCVCTLGLLRCIQSLRERGSLRELSVVILDVKVLSRRG